jgi:RNA polymerase-interacting CarD/CdnL/TRCF family regulator
VTDIQRYEVDGVERRYLCIELINRGSTLMIPVDKVEESGLHRLTCDLAMITAVLSRAPQELADDYRQRQARIAAKIHSGDPKLVAQALRDLVWREKEEKLSMKDEQLKEKAHTLLAGILALQPDCGDISAATQCLNAIVWQAIQTHMGSENGERTSTDSHHSPAPGGNARPLFGIRLS